MIYLRCISTVLVASLALQDKGTYCGTYCDYMYTVILTKHLSLFFSNPLLFQWSQSIASQTLMCVYMT